MKQIRSDLNEIADKQTSFGRALKLLRKQYGITQENVAYDLNMASSKLGCFECEIVKPCFGRIVQLAGYYGCSIKALLRSFERTYHKLPHDCGKVWNVPEDACLCAMERRVREIEKKKARKDK